MHTHGRVPGTTEPISGQKHSASRPAAIQAGNAVQRVSLDELRTLAILKRAATRTHAAGRRVPSMPHAH
jgi:hypothetical protein